MILFLFHVPPVSQGRGIQILHGLIAQVGFVPKNWMQARVSLGVRSFLPPLLSSNSPPEMKQLRRAQCGGVQKPERLCLAFIVSSLAAQWSLPSCLALEQENPQGYPAWHEGGHHRFPQCPKPLFPARGEKGHGMVFLGVTWVTHVPKIVTEQWTWLQGV